MPSAPPTCELRLFRHADTAWTQVVRPWLTAAPGRLARRYVVVPTRGQSHALKQRCLVEGVALLGVEFLSPGLARQKWLALARPAPPALGHELLLLGLRTILARRLARLADAAPPPPELGLLKSLQSDAGRALDHFDELLQAGFSHEHFGLPLLRDLFGELAAWVRETGYDFAQLQSERGALTPVPPEAPRAGSALLIYGLSAEAWGEFFNVAAFARRCGDLTIVLPEPALRGRGLDEQWVKLWEDFLGVEAASLAEEEATPSCAPVGQTLTGEAPPSAPLPCELLVGRTHADEMARVAARIESLLAAGAGNIAVVFPGPETGHRRLAALLAARGLEFADLLETPGTPPIEVRVQRSLLMFYERGGRLEEFLELWTLLRTLDWVKAPPGAARAVCEQLFDECQSHLLAACATRLAAGEHPDWRAVHGLAGRLLPAWPAELTLADALARFDRVCAGFLLSRPVGWDALAAFAERETRLLPLPLVTGTLAAFLPETSPAAATGKGTFARVTFTTRRRAASVAWSHVIFTGANAGAWPVRPESGPWLPDEHRAGLNEVSRFSLGLFTGEDRAQLERDAYAAITRDTHEGVVFSAALFDEEEPELKLMPNVWVERILFWQNGANPGWSLERAWEALSVSVPGASNSPAVAPEELERWRGIWMARRDPARSFDEYFYCADPALRPTRVAAGLIERGLRDPAELWYGALLRMRAVDWRPFARATRKALGQFAHRLLAGALRGEAEEGDFHRLPPPEECRARLDVALAVWRGSRPGDRYWDSFHAELTHVTRALLDKVLALEGGRFAVVEWTLPRGVTLPAGSGRVGVHGRMDVALADHPRWEGSTVSIVDFKTGTIRSLSPARMAGQGEGLQLGVYLAAARELGAVGGRVWMLKPEPGGESFLAMDDLNPALALLARLWEHLATGKYGQLTADRTDYTHGFESPLACAPIKHAVLAGKYAATFGAPPEAEEVEHE